jgi:hypothetical protein
MRCKTYRMRLMSQQLKQLQKTKIGGFTLFPAFGPTFGRCIMASLLAGGALLALTGCQGYSITGGPGPLVSDPLKVSVSPELKASKGKSVLVFPLQNGVGVNLSTEDLAAKSKIVESELEANSTYTVINSVEAKSITIVLEDAKKLKQPLAAQAIKAGSVSKSPLVLYGTLNRFAPFTGSSAPQSPIKFSGSIDGGDFNSPQSDLRGGVASSKSNLPGGVGINLSLLSVETGATLWTANFDVQEASVAENIFQIKHQLQMGKSEGLDQILRLGVRSAVKQLELERKVKR